MILSPEIVHQIKGHKRQMVRLPRNGTKCVYRVGHVYGVKVKANPEAKQACEITVERVEEAIFDDRPVWVIRFKLGNHTDEDRYPAARPGGAGGDYTSIPSRKLAGTGAEVSAHELSRYVAMRDEKEIKRIQEQKRRLDSVLTDIRQNGGSSQELREAHDRINTIRISRANLPASPSEQVGGDVASAQSGA